MRAVSPDDLVKRLLSGGISALVIKVASAGVSYAMMVALARFMSPDEYGRFAFGFSLAITLSFLFSFGLPVAVLRFWPQYQVNGEMGLARSFVARGLSGVFIGSVLSAGLFLVAARAYTGGQEGYTYRYFSAIAALMALMALSEFVASALRADGSIVGALGPRDVLWRVVVIGASALTAASLPSFDAELALQVSAICLAVVLVPQMIYAVRRMQVRRGDLAGPTQYATWRTATWPMWGSAILFGMVQQFDVVLLGFFLSPEQTGPYFAALRTASLMSLMLIAGNMVAGPLIAQFYHGGDTHGLRRMSNLLIVGIAVPTVVGFVLMVVMGRWLLALFDPAFADAYYLLIILSAGFTMTALAGPVAYFLQMVGHEKEYLMIVGLSYAAVVVCQSVLVPIYGPLGAAIPNAVGAVFSAFWAVKLLRSRVGVDPSVLGLAWRVDKPRKSGAAA